MAMVPLKTMHHPPPFEASSSKAREMMRAIGKDMTIKTRLIFLLAGFLGLFAPAFTFMVIMKAFAIAPKDNVRDRDQLNWFISFMAGDFND